MTNAYQALEEDFGVKTTIDPQLSKIVTNARSFNNDMNRKLAEEEEEEEIINKKLKLDFSENPVPATW